ncbi:MAG: Competence protein TfoX [Thermoleophilia bacterium]|nr:Competence protein TfoX [Thermoleophilia bacterium]
MGDADADATARRVAELLLPLGPIVIHRLHGGIGLQLDARTIVIIHEGDVYFRTHRANVDSYVAAGSRALRTSHVDEIDVALPYHVVPEHVLLDSDTACAWAYQSLCHCPE